MCSKFIRNQRVFRKILVQSFKVLLHIPRRLIVSIPLWRKSLHLSKISGFFIQNISAVIKDFRASTRNCGLSTIRSLSSGILKIYNKQNSVSVIVYEIHNKLVETQGLSYFYTRPEDIPPSLENVKT